MKILIISILIMLTGCASTQSQVISDVPKVHASNEIMKDCEEFIYPVDGSLQAFAKALYENKKVYIICFDQNKQKKQFILNNLK